MKLHWQDTEVHRGKYRQVKREVDLVFIEKQTAEVLPHDTVEHYERWPEYTVVILRIKGRPGVFSGVSRFSASKGEVFNYSKGRKLALGRALLQAFPGKHSSARRKAWLSYRLQTETEQVKREEAREVESVADALHQSRMEALDLVVKALCYAPETCNVCHTCNRPQPCTEHPRASSRVVIGKGGTTDGAKPEEG